LSYFPIQIAEFGLYLPPVMKNFILTLFSLLLISRNIYAQETENNLVQFSGMVVTGDSLQPVPNVNIRIKGLNRGTSGDFYGFFSLVARKGEVVQFTAVGYKPGEYLIPDTLQANWYSLIQMMTRDTILLRETVIYPWPTLEQFKHAFVWNQIPDDDFAIAQKNLDKRQLQERAALMPMNGSMNYRNYMNQQVDKLYYRGQIQPMNIFNPFAWAEFIQAWKRGDFKKKN